jgi:hypothetical protein
MATATRPIVNKNRVQLDFSPEALQELDELKNKLGAASRAEVVRYSLRTLQWVMEQLENKTRIVVESGGQSREVVFPFLRVSVPERQLAASRQSAAS